MTETKKRVSKGQALLLIFVSIAIILIGVMVVKAPKPVLLLFDGAVIATLAYCFGISYKDIQNDMVALIKTMIIPILIVFSVGMMIGSWMLSGTVPMMIYYGMELINPAIFFFMACLICAVMSLIMGSSWGTVSTVGIAFLGMAAGLGLPLVATAGAVACGALFGDKLSPMSDSPVVSSAVSNVNIFEGCFHAAKTTGPALILSLIFYLILGFKYHAESGATGDTEMYNLILSTLKEQFNLNPLLLLPPVLVFALIIMKKPTLPTFAVGIVSGGILAMLFQGASIGELAAALNSGYTATCDVDIVNSMLNRGGLSGMLGTASLLIAACVFGAPLRTAGVIDTILDMISGTAKSAKSMTLQVFFLCLSFFIVTGGYDLTYTVVGPMVVDLFDKYKVHRKNLMRILEDTTISLAPIVPWGAMGVFFANTLGVSNMDFILYSPLTWLSPVIGLIYIMTGFTMTKSDGAESDASTAQAN